MTDEREILRIFRDICQQGMNAYGKNGYWGWVEFDLGYEDKIYDPEGTKDMKTLRKWLKTKDKDPRIANIMKQVEIDFKSVYIPGYHKYDKCELEEKYRELKRKWIITFINMVDCKLITSEMQDILNDKTYKLYKKYKEKLENEND